MNLSTTWTSREQSRELNCLEAKHLHSSKDSSRPSQRSEQKTSGLFDTDKASNAPVASKASKPGALDLDAMEAVGFDPNEEDLGGIIADMPFDFTEADFLDSFVDLSSFLLSEESMKGSNVAVSSDVDDGIMKGTVPTDFSGIISHLKAEPTVVEATPEVMTSTTSSVHKRKYVEYEQMVIDDYVVNVEDVSYDGEWSVADHDYVTKKPKLTIPVMTVKASQVASTSQLQVAPVYKSRNKYRERRDKNNLASRRSREIRKQKYVSMDQEADELEVRNEALRKKIIELEALANTMKAVLIKKMTEK